MKLFSVPVGDGVLVFAADDAASLIQSLNPLAEAHEIPMYNWDLLQIGGDSLRHKYAEARAKQAEKAPWRYWELFDMLLVWIWDLVHWKLKKPNVLLLGHIPDADYTTDYWCYEVKTSLGESYHLSRKDAVLSFPGCARLLSWTDIITIGSKTGSVTLLRLLENKFTIHQNVAHIAFVHDGEIVPVQQVSQPSELLAVSSPNGFVHICEVQCSASFGSVQHDPTIRRADGTPLRCGECLVPVGRADVCA